MKNNKKNAAILLLSLLILAGSATSVFQAYAARPTFQIFVDYDLNAGTVSGDLQVHNNQDATVTISPKPGYSFDSVIINGDPYTIDDSRAPIVISFTKVKSDQLIVVTFIVDVSAQFEEGNAITSELVLATDADLPDLLPTLGGVTPYYQVEITEGEFSGLITITVYYDESSLPADFDENNLRLYIGNPVDFDGNDTVNGNDVALIQEEAKKDPLDQDLETYDVNHDGKLDSIDIDIVKDYANSGLIVNPGQDNAGQFRIPWIDITTNLNTAEDYIQGVTWHLSIFGCR